MASEEESSASLLPVAGDAAWATLGPAELDELREFGVERPVAVGELLFRAGDLVENFFVVLEGEVDIIRAGAEHDELIATHGAGRFVGELNLLTGQRAFLSARVTHAGRVLVIAHTEFRRLMSTKADLADTIFRGLIARRELLRQGDAAQAVRIIGSRYSSEAMALRAFAIRARLVHTWIDLEDADDIDVLLASMGLRPVDTPVVITPTAILRHPTPGEFAEHLGLTFTSVPGYVFDLVVIGTGPAGLAAAVYGASEGLDTVSLDAVGTGGQAGASSRIENYVGFPNGISGEDLVVRAAIQAQRLGARLSSPCAVAGLRTDSAFHAVVLADGSEIPCRTVIVASGARYQRLAVADLERFEGAGVYYAATDLEARICTGSDVIVIGGGNSAGQAALYLAQQGSRVSIAIRGSDLAKSMSAYLIERIAADPRIQVLTNTEVRATGRRRAPRTRHCRVHTDGRAPNPSVHRALLLHRRRSLDGVARGSGGVGRQRFRPDGSITSRRRARHDVRHARSAALRDVGTRRLRRGRRAPCLAQARRGGGG